jgi:hypothetical protein
MPKNRTTVPEQIAVHVLFMHDHTCCLCSEKGKQVQIHHIDEDPSNHDVSNLAVLCLECHDWTQRKGGFGKKHSAAEIRKFRDKWLTRVAQRRARADEIAAAKQAGMNLPALDGSAADWHRPSDLILAAYVASLPELRKAAFAVARGLWDSPVTNNMRQGTFAVADIAEQIWCHLASWFPPRHFGEQTAQEYISSYLASRYRWHLALAELNSPGSGGTIARLHAASGMMTDAEIAVVDTVRALMLDSAGFNFDQWLMRWTAAERRPLCGRASWLWRLLARISSRKREEAPL